MFELKNNISRKTNSKTIQSLKKLKNPDNKKMKELSNLLSSIPSGVEIEQMVKGKVFSIKFDQDSSYFYLDGEENAKYYERVVENIFDDTNESKYNLTDAIDNLSSEKKIIIHDMLSEEIVKFSNFIKFKGSLNNLDISQLLNIYYDKPIEELERVYNNFFGIGKGMIVSKDKILKISDDVSQYGNNLRNGEKEIGVHFMTAKVKEYCHSFVKVDDNNYECIYSNIPA